MDLRKIRRIYFVGIGGIGMSAVAGFAKIRGLDVLGSDGDDVYPPARDILKQNHIPVIHPYDASHVKNPDCVVIGGGETEQNPEIRAAIAKRLPIVSFPELLAALIEDRTRIVIAGTHGKTTTTSMLAWALAGVRSNPGFFIGGLSRDFRTNFSPGAKPYFIIEGDEYYSSAFDKRPKFLHFRPHLLLLTSIEMDHFDYFRNQRDLLDKFHKLIVSMPPSGTIIANHDDRNIRQLLKECDRSIRWYGLRGSAMVWKGENISDNGEFLRFTARNLKTTAKEKIELRLAGIHNVSNTLAVIAAMDELGFNIESYRETLRSFQGAKRRFEVKGIVNGMTMIDDYAHHPTAVRATLAAARGRFPNRRIIAIYEPHTYSRTLATLSDLSQSFQDADVVLIPEVYSAREKSSVLKISGRTVAEKIGEYHSNVRFLPTQKTIVHHLLKRLKTNDVVIVMTVGSFHEVTEDLLNRLHKIHGRS